MTQQVLDCHMTDDQHTLLEDLSDEVGLLRWVQGVGEDSQVRVASCYIWHNNRHDPPLGDMVLRVDVWGSEHDVSVFCSNLMLMLQQTDVT